MLKIFLTALILFLLPAHIVYGGADAVCPENGLLLLVNANNRLDANYKPPGLTTFRGFHMRTEVTAPFTQMTAAMEADHVPAPRVQSAYRDYAHQDYLFTQKRNFYKRRGFDDEAASAYAAHTVAYPGASEHQSGLALDVTVSGALSQAFGETAQGKWLSEHCHEYGFIIRYPENKTDVTRIIYEPWHLRYVGAPHAALMKEKNFCLEEYLEYLALNRLVIFWNGDGTYYLIECGGEKKIITTLLKSAQGMLK